MRIEANGPGRKIFIIFLIVAMLIACAGMADAASSTWSKTYGISGKNEKGNSVIRLSDGYAILGNNESSSGGPCDVNLVRTELNGNLRWSRTYGGGGGDVGYAIIQDGDSFIIAGATYSFGHGGFDFYLIKVNSDGTEAWNRTYGKDTTDERAFSVARIGDNYVLAGSTGSLASNKVYLVKTDLDGNQIWAKSYGTGCTGNCVIGVTDGGIDYYLIAGNKNHGDYRDAYLLKVRPDGTFIENIFGEDDADETASSVIAVGNTYYVVGTVQSGPTLSSYKAFVLEVNNKLEKIRVHTYGNGKQTEGHSIIKMGNSLIIAGNTKSPEDPYLASISLDGDLIKEYIKNVVDDCYINSITSTIDKDYVIAGYTKDSADETDVYLAKIDSSMLNPTPTPTLMPFSSAIISLTASAGPTATLTEEPDIISADEPGSAPVAEPVTESTSVPTIGAEASATPSLGAWDTVTPAASPTSQAAPASSGDFSTSSVVIIVLLTVIATALAGIGVWLFTQKKK